jgi:hypothetical protein
MKACGTAIGVGAGVMVTSDVVTLMDSCESTEGIQASTIKIETCILDRAERRNSSKLRGKWMYGPTE